MSDASFNGSFSALLLKPFMIRSGAACNVVENILECLFVAYVNLTTSLASEYSSILKVIVGPFGFFIILR